MTAVHITPVGIALASIFAASVTRILWWMLHPPKMHVLPEVAGLAAEAAEARLGRILVGTRGSPLGDRLVELGAKLASAAGAPLAAIYVIELPMTVPLDVDVPEEIREGRRALERAREIAARRGLSINTSLTRARKAGRAIVEAALAQPTQAVVIGIGERRNFEDRLFGSTADYVVKHAPCDVVLERSDARASTGGAAPTRGKAPDTGRTPTEAEAPAAPSPPADRR